MGEVKSTPRCPPGSLRTEREQTRVECLSTLKGASERALLTSDPCSPLRRLRACSAHQ